MHVSEEHTKHTGRVAHVCTYQSTWFHNSENHSVN